MRSHCQGRANTKWIGNGLTSQSVGYKLTTVFWRNKRRKMGRRMRMSTDYFSLPKGKEAITDPNMAVAFSVCRQKSSKSDV